jgi:hypothetical protein
MQHRLKSLLLVCTTVAASVLAPNLEADSRAPIHLALSDILRCSPASEPEPGRLERVGSTPDDAWIYPTDIYDPADCARANQDLVEVKPAPVPRSNA